MAVWTVGFLQEDTRPCIFQQVLVFGESFPLKVFMRMTGRFQMHSILCNFSFEVVIYAFSYLFTSPRKAIVLTD